MPIIQNIARKQGKINPKPTKRVISNTVFGPRGQAGANVGDATNPGNPSYLTAVGKDYNNQISSTGGATNPVGSHSDTATQLSYPALISNATVDLVPPNQAKDVMPHEKGNFFSPQTLKETSMRVSGGVDSNSNTPFHPKTMTVTRQVRKPSPFTARRSYLQSFNTSHTLTGATTGLEASGRWSKTKRSASDALAPATLASPHTGGHDLGHGGVTSTNGAQTKLQVNTNAHAGSPYVVPWVPNRRGPQPNEKGNTNPLKQPCYSCGA
jgi:hypothetical protein